MFSFLYYQAYRAPKKRGKKRKDAEEDTVREIFDMADFNKVMNRTDDEIAALENEELVGYDVINQSVCAILKIWQNQVIHRNLILD